MPLATHTENKPRSCFVSSSFDVAQDDPEALEGSCLRGCFPSARRCCVLTFRGVNKRFGRARQAEARDPPERRHHDSARHEQDQERRSQKGLHLHR